VRGVLNKELTEFFQSGVSVLIGTRDARLLPDHARALGLRVEPGGAELTVFLPCVTAQRTLENLADNARIAVCVSRAEDHRSIQVKGKLLELRAALDTERGIVERYRGLVAASWGFVGMSPSLTFRLNHWPCHALRMSIEAIFQQTPGPEAGAPLRSQGASSK
jgi:hypothetical protein